MSGGLPGFLRDRWEEIAAANGPCPRDDTCDGSGGDTDDCWEHVAVQWHTADCGAMMGGRNAPCSCGLPQRVVAEVDAKLGVLADHMPHMAPVEPEHDQTGTGRALCCPRCHNIKNDNSLRDILRQEGTALPEWFVPSYVRAPCRTLRLLALPYASHPDYRKEWRP